MLVMTLPSHAGYGAAELVLAVAHQCAATDRQGVIVTHQGAAIDCQGVIIGRQGAVEQQRRCHRLSL
jgi:hypothetical protein